MITRRATIGNELREAVFSEDEIYRLRLTITWSPDLGTMTTIGLNPSTATHEKDDPTIRACKKLAKDLGYGAYQMLNAFALRSTDYKGLFRSSDPIGPENTIEFLKHWCDGTFVIAMWGAHITERPWKHFYRGRQIAEAIPGLHSLHVTKSGHPGHILYLPVGLIPQPFVYAE